MTTEEGGQPLSDHCKETPISKTMEEGCLIQINRKGGLVRQKAADMLMCGSDYKADIKNFREYRISLPKLHDHEIHPIKKYFNMRMKRHYVKYAHLTSFPRRLDEEREHMQVPAHGMVVAESIRREMNS
ncbi:hypothetical protein H920_09603 [Fukomys damarensis]|uniref:Uncharacterized protein n=1 Tax=Fukomys damarensis TaxID=885580 RepID=A0A091DEL8_FUKDA|nr:hypothetical protein H920_09603 [Fukomys damarensis]